MNFQVTQWFCAGCGKLMDNLNFRGGPLPKRCPECKHQDQLARARVRYDERKKEAQSN